MSETREFRLYCSDRGDESVLGNIGEEMLEQAIHSVRAAYPQSVIVVREVNESVIRVIHPDGSEQTFD